MGGRGGYSGKYSNVSLSSLQSMLSRQENIMRENRIARQLDPNSSSSVVRRKQRMAEKAYNAAATEVEELKRAIEKAKKRKRAIPF